MKNIERTGTIECVCLNCGKVTKTVPARVALGYGKYCGVPCKNEHFGYKRLILAVLPATMNQIAERAKVEIGTVRKQVLQLQRAGKCHASGITAATTGSGKGYNNHELVYSLGPAEDPATPHEKQPAITFFYEKMILEAMPSVQRKICAVTGLSQSTVSRIVTRLHAEGKCHVHRWRKGAGGRRMAVYKEGRGVDAVCNIPPLTTSEINARYKAKATRTGKIVEIRARNNACTRAAKQRKNGDRLVNALFGKPAERMKEAA